MEKKLLSFIRDNILILPGSRILIAVSGGSDSMALLHFLLMHRNLLTCEIGVAHVHHLIRGKEADKDADYVRNFCAGYYIPFYFKKLDVPLLAVSEKIGIEEAGRRARYAFFKEIMQHEGYDLLATAHHQDDQAETLLMRLIRGTGLKGACGIAVKQGKVIRPMLCVSKKEIENYCHIHSVKTCFDSTNDDDGLTRNRIRHQVIPVLNDIHGKASVHLADFCQKAAEAQFFLSSIADQTEANLFGNHPDYCEIKILEQLHPFLMKEMIRKGIGHAGHSLVDVTQHHIESVIRQLEKESTQWQIHIIRGILVRREYGLLYFEAEREFSVVSIPTPLMIDRPGRYDYENYVFKVDFLLTKELISSQYKKKRCEILLSCDTIDTGLCFRSRKPGDTISLPGMQGHKKVKDLLIDRKIPRNQRDFLPMLAMGSKILWIPGIAVDRKCIRINPDSEITIKITMENIDEPGH